jgi:hypothetical protein
MSTKHPSAQLPRRAACGLRLWLVLLVGALLSGCSRTYELEWDEEVRMHDGRIIVTNVKSTYERQAVLDRYDPALFRESVITFDAGPPRGRVTQHFIHHRPIMLDNWNGEWFVILQGRAGSVDSEWGPAQNTNGQRVAKLGATSFERASIAQLPDVPIGANLLMDTMPKRELASFNGTRITLPLKSGLLLKYPLQPMDVRIERSAPR